METLLIGVLYVMVLITIVLGNKKSNKGTSVNFIAKRSDRRSSFYYIVTNTAEKSVAHHKKMEHSNMSSIWAIKCKLLDALYDDIPNNRDIIVSLLRKLRELSYPNAEEFVEIYPQILDKIFIE